MEGLNLELPTMKRQASDNRDINYASLDIQIKRRNSLPNLKESSEITRAYILVNVMNLGLNPDLAEIILEEYDILQDKNILLQQICSRLMMMDVRQLNFFLQISQEEYQTQVQEQPVLISSLIKKLSPQAYFKSSKIKNKYQLVEEDHITCPICYNEVQNKFNLEECQHELCIDCVQQYLLNKIITADVINISCPINGCQTLFTQELIQKHTNEVQFKKYKQFLKMKILSENTNLRWCPSGCENYVEGDGKTKKLKCKCGVEICFSCGNQYHGIRSCKDSLDKQFTKAMSKYEIVQCRKCKSAIQKNEGCNHMTCRNCNYQFCWICGGQYSPGHYNANPWNYIIGCPSNQYAIKKPWKYPKLWRSFLIFWLIFLICLSPLVLALLIILSGFVTPSLIFMKFVPKNKFDQYQKINRILCYILAVVLGICLYPLNICINILLALGYGLFQLKDYIFYTPCGKSCGLVVLSPLLLVLAPLAGPALLYMKKVPRSQFNTYSRKYQIFVFVMWGLMGIICYPLTVICCLLIGLYFIFKGIIFVGQKVWKMFR